MTQHFASDNNAGICPEALAALKRANATGHELSYGEDRWTAAVCDGLRALFETDCEVFFVFNGTAANSLALSAMCQSYHAVICHEQATSRPTSAARRSSSRPAPSCWRSRGRSAS